MCGQQVDSLALCLNVTAWYKSVALLSFSLELAVGGVRKSTFIIYGGFDPGAVGGHLSQRLAFVPPTVRRSLLKRRGMGRILSQKACVINHEPLQKRIRESHYGFSMSV